MQHAHHVRQARGALAVQENLLALFPGAQQLHRHVVNPVPLFHGNAAGAHFAVPGNNLPVLGGAVAAAQGAVVHRLQQVGLAAAIGAEEKIDARVQRQLQGVIIAELF